MKVLRLEELEIMKNIFENLSSITSTDLMCSVTDKSNFIFYKKGNGIDVKAVVGEKVSDSDPLISCMKQNMQIKAIVPKEIYGVPFKATCTPILDSKGEVIGAIGIGINLEKEAKLSDMSTTLASISEEITANLSEISDNAHSISEENDSLFEELSKVDSLIAGTEKIFEVINSISTSLNILSLNARIESARLGESGKIFGVVAEEMKKLSDQSKDNVKEIEIIIKNINESMLKARDISINTSKSAKNENENIKEMLTAVEELSIDAQELADFSKLG